MYKRCTINAHNYTHSGVKGQRQIKGYELINVPEHMALPIPIRLFVGKGKDGWQVREYHTSVIIQSFLNPHVTPYSYPTRKEAVIKTLDHIRIANIDEVRQVWKFRETNGQFKNVRYGILNP